MIKFENVSIQKGDRTVLDNITWQASEGENWAIIGENGSGKSTFLEAIAGRIFPQKGSISKPDSKEIAFVATDYSFNRLVQAAMQYYQQRYNTTDAEIAPTVREILQNQIKPIGTIDTKSVDLPPARFSEEQLTEKANLLIISHLLDRKIVSLSNGETRRTLITLSLLQAPKILLLDNPFVGLDTESRTTLHQVLNQVITSGVQIIIVTSPKEIPTNITNIVELRGGKINKISSQVADFQQVINNLGVRIVPEILATIALTPANNDFEYALSMRNVTVTYGGINVVENVNWQVKCGEKWALMGANGSGKSTILSLITADNPQGYQNDYDLFDRKRGSGESIWDIKQRIGYVSPELHLYFTRHTEVWKAVASGLFDTAGLFKKLNNDERTLTENYLKLLNISYLHDRKMSQISTGEQRLVFLARALVKNPPLLLLDEPCQGLDYQHLVYFRDLVNDLVLKLNKTLIYVTHYEDEIPACVNKRLTLKQGKVVLE